MNRKLFIFGLVLLLAIALGAEGKSAYGQGAASDSMAFAGPQAPDESIGTRFTYQGYLESAGVPVDSTCDFQFRLYDASVGDSQVGPMNERTGVLVEDGYFTIPDLDYGEGVFVGEARYLGITVRCGGGSYETLTPRQEITPSPYALALPGFYTRQHSTSPNVLGGHSSNQITVGVEGGTISGGGYQDSPTEYNHVFDNYGVVGGGSGNFAGDGWGTFDDAEYATVGGGHGNKSHKEGSTVAGGVINEAYYRATVGGGYGNVALGNYATIPGGHSNRADGELSFAAGYQAQANHRGAFVWADGLGVPFTSTDENQFIIRAYNGVGIGTNNPQSDLHLVGELRLASTDPADHEWTMGVLDTGADTWFYIKDDDATVEPYKFVINQDNGDVAVINRLGVNTEYPEDELHVIGRGIFEVGGGDINFTTPGGWPGIIAYSPGNYRREMIFRDDRFQILISDSDAASPNDSGIIMNNQGDVGIGTYNPTAKLDVNGTARTEVLQITGGADLAEPFEILGAENVQPGMLVAIHPEHPGQLQIADSAYDVKVAGCVSGANGLQPGLVMEGLNGNDDASLPVALSGRVYCWADAGYGAIQPGDLLTSSGTPGHVMVVKDHQAALGAIVGKAMSALEKDRGLILVLVALQ